MTGLANGEVREAEETAAETAEYQSKTPEQGTMEHSEQAYTLSNIYIYPVKSCGAFEVRRWPLGARGLLYDRAWMVVNENGVCLSQKREARLCLIRPRVRLSDRRLLLLAEGTEEELSLPLESQDQSEVCAGSQGFYMGIYGNL